jgi:hypothetical protein
MLSSLAALGMVVGVSSPWFALIASFCVLGLFDLALPYLRTRMPPSLRQVRPWEIQSGTYRAIGVPVFGALLRRSPLRLLNRRVYLKSANRDLSLVRTHLENAESAHFWGAVATLPYVVITICEGWWAALTSVMVFNVGVNLYPILHLRLARARIDRAVQNSRSRPLRPTLAGNAPDREPPAVGPRSEARDA